MSLPMAPGLKEPVLWVETVDRALNKELIKDVKRARRGREQRMHPWYSRGSNKLNTLRKNSWVSKICPEGKVCLLRLLLSDRFSPYGGKKPEIG